MSFHFKRLAIQYRCRMGMVWCNILMCGSVDNNRRRSPGKLRLSSSNNLRISNRRNSSLSSSRSINNSRSSLGKLHLSNNCNMRIRNKTTTSPAAGGGAQEISP
jgi:hypothetical protein